jgi:hypothetical protein
VEGSVAECVECGTLGLKEAQVDGCGVGEERNVGQCCSVSLEKHDYTQDN